MFSHSPAKSVFLTSDERRVGMPRMKWSVCHCAETSSLSQCCRPKVSNGAGFFALIINTVHEDTEAQEGPE